LRKPTYFSNITIPQKHNSKKNGKLDSECQGIKGYRAEMEWAGSQRTLGKAKLLNLPQSQFYHWFWRKN